MGAFNSILRSYRMAKRVTFDGEHPDEISSKLSLTYLRAIGAWPSRPSQESYRYTALNAIIMLALVSFVVTITFDLYEASSDFITFGDDLCVLVGLYLILFKIILYRIYKPNIEWIAAEYLSLHKKYTKCSQTVRAIQRSNFIQEVLTFITYSIMGNFLFAAIGFQPLLSGQSKTLPFRAKFPFSVDDPRVFVAVYMFQCICTLVNVKVIVYIDNAGCVFINQTSVNLKILCQRIRELPRSGMRREDLGEIVSDHQKIISLIDYVNEYYHLNYVAQVGASTFLICLTAFEAQLASHQPLVALKFQTYMFSSFMQLLYWCWVGNKVHFDVATAAYECEWAPQTGAFRRDLMFVIQRAQKPLLFRAAPFYGFDYASFANILSSSYSYFTLLRTLND